MLNNKLLKNFISPHNAGALRGANAVAKVGSTAMGDLIKLSLLFNEETDVIEDAKFKAFGSPEIIAISNLICDMLKGRNAEEALNIESNDILNVAGEIDIKKTYCALTAEDAIKEAVRNYQKYKATKFEI